ncbi:MAG TPA: patatin-like phospholipase family protein [Nitrososphaeraceae archaeon]|nr:patatin-like phospholipase family protein [Nitrososphaeraceae archaeon]
MNTTNRFQRALVFQGGGSLGAYEAGVYKATYELLSERDIKLGREGKPLFHIVAGTSIGAMNAAVLVSYVKENKSWQGSADRLIEFWEYMATESFMDIIPGFNEWWNYWHYFNKDLASSESARRYYGTKQFMFRGVPKVFGLSKTLEDKRFLDPVNTRYLYSNEPLKRSLEKFAKFPIATSYQNNEPRLLLVSVDVQEGSTVVFDSYEKEDGTRKTEYGRYGPEFARGPNDREGYEHVISHIDGIEVDFVLASGSVPVNYDYTKLGVEDSNGRHGTTKKVRYFWDGGIIANTPLREVVIEHRRYWDSVRRSEVPPLRVFIVNVHPIKQDSLPVDYDALVDRKNDLTYHDRTLFDERMAIMITDYVSIINSLIKLAEDNKVKKALVDNILEQKAETRHFSTGQHFKYSDLVENMVSVEQVIRIERQNDVHTIANKIFDFSRATLRQLMRDGYEETLEQETRILQVWDSEHPR